MQVSPRQQQIYDFIARFIEGHAHSPTVDEIRQHFRLRSGATVHEHLVALERAGLISRAPLVSRGISLTEAHLDRGDCEIPLLGVVAAGRPIEAILHSETVCVPRNMTGSGRTFALRVRGDSMTGEHILDGDIIVVAAAQTAANGQTVVALIDNHEATVKRIFRERVSVRLESANPRYKPLRIRPPQRLSVQGIVIGVIRPLAVQQVVANS